MTYQEIFEKTREIIFSHDVEGIEGNLAVEVDIVGEGEGAFYIEIKDGKVNVEPYEYYDNDCKLIIGGEDFIKICEGTLNAVKAFTVGKLKVSGDIDKALEFSKTVDNIRNKKSSKTRSAKKKK